MIRVGRVRFVGVFVMLTLFFLTAKANNAAASPVAATAAFKSVVQKGLEPLPYGCKATKKSSSTARTLSSATRSRVQHLCQLGRESRYLFRHFTRDDRTQAIWLPRRAKCQQAPGEQWAARCYLARRKMRNHLERLVWIRETVNQLVPSYPVPKWLEDDFDCIHTHEGSWTDPNAPYWGGVQMDLDFMQTYGPEFYARYGTADHWPRRAQILAAARAYASGRGFGPWPHTALMCGFSIARITPPAWRDSLWSSDRTMEV